jgi:retron-type reverse transcriptase
MNKAAIRKAASNMTTVFDLLALLNRIKKDELGVGTAHEFTIAQLNYFLNPRRSIGHYRTFSIPKKSGGLRTISAPVKMLKSFQTYVGKLLEAFYDAPDCVMGFTSGRSVVDNAELHYGKAYVFNTDLKDFFPSISQARVWGNLKGRPFNFDEKIASAIAGLCCIRVPVEGVPEDAPEKERFRHVLPQGSPASPVLTNIVCRNLDRKLSGVARRFHLRYTRYADDITFSGNQDVFQEGGEFITELRRVISSEHFTINEKKTRVQRRHERQEVTGLVVNDRVNVTRDYFRDVENLLFIWERHGTEAAYTAFIKHYTPKQNLNTGIPDMHSVVQGKLLYMRMVKGDDNRAWRKLQRRFNRLSGLKEDACGTSVIYKYTYPIASFEKKLGTKIEFINWRDHLAPTFRIGEQVYYVHMSRYVKTRLKHALRDGTEEDLDKFRRKYLIALCEKPAQDDESGRREPYWMLIRHLPKQELSEADLDTIVNEMMQSGGAAADDAPGLSTDETLAALISSGFDLNTLDQWDKTKSS